MDTHDAVEDLIPNDLLERVEALASAEHRSARDVLRDAVEWYLQERRAKLDSSFAAPTEPRNDMQDVVNRILELRTGNVLPEGVTIRDLMTHGRS